MDVQRRLSHIFPAGAGQEQKRFLTHMLLAGPASFRKRAPLTDTQPPRSHFRRRAAGSASNIPRRAAYVTKQKPRVTPAEKGKPEREGGQAREAEE